MMTVAAKILSLWILCGGWVWGEIVAWKVPIEQIFHISLEDSDCVRTDRVPEKVSFIAEGDEVWDVKSEMRGLGPERLPEWIVWHPKTGRLVAKCGGSTLLGLHLLAAPKTFPYLDAGMKLDFFEVPPDLSDWSPESKKAGEFVWVNPMAMRCSVAKQGPGSSEIRVCSEAHSSERTPLVDGQIELTCSLAGFHKIQLETSFSVLAGRRLWLARSTQEGRGIDIVLQCSKIGLDGNPVAREIIVDNGDRASGMPLLEKRKVKKLADGGTFSLVPYTPQELVRALDHFGAKRRDEKMAEDPFTIRPLFEVNVDIPDARIPEKLLPEVSGAVLDVKAFVEHLGVNPGDADFVGYDVIQEAMVIYSPNKEVHSRMRALLEKMERGRNPLLAISLDFGDKLRLVGKHAQKFRMSAERDGTGIHRLEVQPNIGESPAFIRVDLQAHTGGEPGFSYEGSKMVSDGKRSRLLESEGKSLWLRADVVDVEGLPD